jgi:hypothetical protein
MGDIVTKIEELIEDGIYTEERRKPYPKATVHFFEVYADCGPSPVEGGIIQPVSDSIEGNKKEGVCQK